MEVTKCHVSQGRESDVRTACPSAEILGLFALRGVECWIIREARAVVAAFAIVLPRGSCDYMGGKSLEIKTLYVAFPSHGVGKGYRSALMGRLCERVQELGFSGLFYTVGSRTGGGEEQIVPFLEHKGFRQHPRYHAIYALYCCQAAPPPSCVPVAPPSPPHETGRIFRISLADVELKSMMRIVGGKRKDARPNSSMYQGIVPGDTIQYYSKTTPNLPSVNMLVWRRKNYETFREMLLSEGVSSVLSTYSELGPAVKFYLRIDGYLHKERKFQVVCFYLTPRATAQKRIYELRPSDEGGGGTPAKRPHPRYTSPPR